MLFKFEIAHAVLVWHNTEINYVVGWKFVFIETKKKKRAFCCVVFSLSFFCTVPEKNPHILFIFNQHASFANEKSNRILIVMTKILKPTNSMKLNTLCVFG